MPLQRVRVDWTGFKGAPGFSNHYFSPGTPPPLTALRTFYEALKAFLPTGTTLTYPGAGDVINETTGTVTDSWTTAAPATTVGTGAGVYSGTSGFLVEWLTSTVLDGRRPRGKTFIVPVISTCLATDGTLSDTNVATVKAAADAFVAATTGQFFVWHRPIKNPDPPHNVTRLGGVAAVTGTLVPDKQMVLRSRRQ
jgi:hypothetical protein